MIEKLSPNFQTKTWNLSFDDFHSYDEHCVVLDFGILMKNPSKCVQTSCKKQKFKNSSHAWENDEKVHAFEQLRKYMYFQCKMMHFVRPTENRVFTPTSLSREAVYWTSVFCMMFRHTLGEFRSSYQGYTHPSAFGANQRHKSHNLRFGLKFCCSLMKNYIMRVKMFGIHCGKLTYKVIA